MSDTVDWTPTVSSLVWLMTYKGAKLYISYIFLNALNENQYLLLQGQGLSLTSQLKIF